MYYVSFLFLLHICFCFLEDYQKREELRIKREEEEKKAREQIEMEAKMKESTLMGEIAHII